MNDIGQIDALLANPRFKEWVLSNKVTHSRYWQEWLAQHPEQEQAVLAAEQFILELQFKKKQVSPALLHQEWQRLQPRIQPNRFKFFQQPLFKIAASLLFFITLGTALYFSFFYNPSLTVSTNFAELKKVELPDGSLVTLSGNASLTYEKQFSKQPERIVTLEGEAYFEVKHQENPFIVKTKDFDIKVLGTTFGVCERPGKKRIALVTGKVEVQFKEMLTFQHEEASIQQKTFILSPGEVLESYESMMKPYFQVSPKAKQHTAWINQTLIFDYTPVEELCRILKDNFGLKVILEDETLRKEKISGTIPTNELSALLKAIPLILEVEVEKVNDTTITFKRLNQLQ